MRRKSNLLKDYPDEALLEEVRRVSELVDKPVLTCNDFTEHSGLSADVLRRRFGGWRVVLERAGLGHMYSREAECPRYSDEELLEELRRVAGLVEGPVFRQSDFRKHGRFTLFMIKTLFGTWGVALQRAGVGHMYYCTLENRVSVGRVARGASSDDLLNDMRRVALLVGKPVLSQADFKRCSKMAVQTLVRRFGSWQAALQCAGLGHMWPGESWRCQQLRTDEELLELVRRAAELVGKPMLTHNDFRKHTGFAPSVLIRRFGSWSDVLDRAGVGHMCYEKSTKAKNFVHTKISDEELLEELRRVAELIEKPVILWDDFDKLSLFRSVTLTSRFGGWRAALDRAGLAHMFSGKHKIIRCPSPYTDDMLLAEVRRVAQLTNQPILTVTDFRKHSSIGNSTLKQRFGLWQDVLDRAGIGHMYSGALVERRFGYTDEMLLEEVRRVAEEVQTSTLKTKEFDRRAAFSHITVSRRFGSWQAALESAGVGAMYNGAIGVSHHPCADEVLLEEVRRVAGLVEKPELTIKDFKKHSGFGINTLTRRFGSWRDVLERAGVGHMCSTKQINQQRSDEEILEMMRQVAAQVGRGSFTRNVFHSATRIWPATIIKRFGSWHLALECAGLTPLKRVRS